MAIWLVQVLLDAGVDDEELVEKLAAQILLAAKVRVGVYWVGARTRHQYTERLHARAHKHATRTRVCRHAGMHTHTHPHTRTHAHKAHIGACRSTARVRSATKTCDGSTVGSG